MNWAGVLYGIDDLRYQNTEIPPINNDEVLIKIKCTGICGSDIPRVKTKGTYTFPTIPGHEFAGVITAKGTKVQNVIVGDRVSVYPLISCKECFYCKKSQDNLCEKYNYLGSRCNGGFAELVKCPAINVLKIPESVSYEEAALLEPIAVAFRGVKRAKVKLQDKIIVFGLGPIGLFAAQWAKLAGTSLVVGVDRNNHKLKIAQECGIDYVINSQEKDFELEINKTISSKGADLIFECSGANVFYQTGINLIKKGGVISLIGNPQQNINFNEKTFQLILRKEITLIGNWNSLVTPSENEWKISLEALASRKLLVSPIITHRFQLKEIKPVFDNLYYRKYENYCKGVFIVNND